MMRLSAVLCLLLVAGSGHAERVCAVPYAHAKDAILDAEVGQGLERKLVTKVENAWRIFGSGKKNAKKTALHDLSLALNLLERKSTRQLPEDLRSALVTAVGDFRRCIENGEIATASLTVRVTRPDGTTVPGAVIRVNDEEVGTTGPDGTLGMTVPAGGTRVSAIVYVTEQGDAFVTLTPGASSSVDVLLGNSEPHEPSTLILAESVDAIVPRDFGSFTLHFLDPAGNLVPLGQIEDIRLAKADGSGWTYWADTFEVTSEGSVRPRNLAVWRDAVRFQRGKLALDVQAQDRRGRLHAGTVTFYLGYLSVEARLVSPPSNPSLPVGGLPVAISLLGSDLIVRTVTDPDGTFPVPLLPEGTIVFSASTVSGGQHYYADAVFAINDHYRIRVNLLHTQDKINRVPPYTLETLPRATRTTTETPPTDLRRSLPGSRPGVHAVAATAGSVEVTVRGGARDVRIEQAASFTVPQGTPKIILRYEVRSDEYPTYVLVASRYNDWWHLEATANANGARLFQRLRQVNSQLALSPTWQSTGSTGELQVELDTQTLTQDGPAEVTLYAATANVGDSMLPTTVTATLSTDFEAAITSIEHDAVLGFPDRSPRETRGDHTYFSIPRVGAENYAQRHLTVGMQHPEGATVENVQVFLKGILGFNEFLLMPEAAYVDEAPGTEAVMGSGGGTYKVRVTFAREASPFTSVPPPARRIRYLVKARVKHDNAVKTIERESPVFNPLWRMPDGLPRYGQPSGGIQDWGEDDWCSFATFHWLDQNRALMSKINDVSGEHAANTGHQQHHQGREIDLYHYYTFPGQSTWAKGNYLQLVRYTQESVSADEAVRANARAQLVAWVTAMRSAIDALTLLADVEQVITSDGATQAGLADGWAQSLLKTGSTSVSGEIVNLGLGSWACGVKCMFNNVHDDHIHITLTQHDFN
jgi:hypothetical protein